MSILHEIRPTEKLRIIDLAEQAGLDVSPWSQCKRGKAGAAANGKYCYAWSFNEDDKIIVLNLWHDNMTLDPEAIQSEQN